MNIFDLDAIMENPNILHQISERAGITEQQAAQALKAVTEFAKERFPILESTIDTFVRQELDASASGNQSDTTDEEQ